MFSSFRGIRRELREEDTKLVQKSFEFASQSKRGWLNRDDLKVALVAALGYKPSKYEIDGIMQKHGKSRAEFSGEFENSDEIVLDFPTYKVVILEKMKHWDLDEEVRETFQLLDARCKGFIEYSDFEKVVRKFLPNQDAVNIKKMFSEADRDGDGRVSFRDFQLVMQQKGY